MVKEIDLVPDTIPRIPMPVDPETFAPAPNTDHRQTIILTVARLIQRKGTKYLIQACSSLKAHDFELRVIGGGSEREALENLTEQPGLASRVNFINSVPHRLLRDHINECDVFVLPALEEGLGMVLLEALSCKKPVIATNIGGIPDIITDNQTGILIPPQDVKALSAAVLKVLEDRSFAKSIAEKGYERVLSRFTIEPLSHEMVTVYDSLSRSR